MTLNQCMYTDLARVRATFSRRGSLRKPIPWCSLDLTQLSMMKSFSLPWKASTLATSSSYKGHKICDIQKYVTLYLVELLGHRSIGCHVLDNVGSLSFIRSDHSYLFWLYPTLHQPCNYLLYIDCLSSETITEFQ